MSTPPTGFQISVAPQPTPFQDPRLFASDPIGALAAAHAGNVLGQEYADLQNKQAQRDVLTAQLKSQKAQADLDQILGDQKLKIIQDPNTQAAIAANTKTQLLAVQQASAQQAQNEAAAAAAGAQFSGLDPVAKAQAIAAAQAQGGWGRFPRVGSLAPAGQTLSKATAVPFSASMLPADMSLGGATAAPAAAAQPAVSAPETSASAAPAEQDETPPVFREVHWTDTTDSDGNMVQVPQVFNKLTGEPIGTGAAIPKGTWSAAKVQDQATAAKAMERFMQFPDAASVIKDNGEFDGPKARALGAGLAAENPVIGGLVDQTTFNGLKQAYRAVKIIDDIPKQLDALGDPSTAQRVLTSLPQPDKATGIFTTTREAFLKQNIKPKTAARAALLSALDAQYQNVLNTTIESREARKFNPADSDQVNAAIKEAVSVLSPYLHTAYDDMYNGVPAPVRKAVEGSGGLAAVGAEAAARKAIPQYLQRATATSGQTMVDGNPVKTITVGGRVYIVP
jgi:hypothetical protein